MDPTHEESHHMTSPADRRAHDPYAPPPRPAQRNDPPPVQGPGEPDQPASSVQIPDAGELARMRKPDLVDLASALGLDFSGTRDDLIDRIETARDNTDS